MPTWLRSSELSWILFKSSLNRWNLVRNFILPPDAWCVMSESLRGSVKARNAIGESIAIVMMRTCWWRGGCRSYQFWSALAHCATRSDTLHLETWNSPVVPSIRYASWLETDVSSRCEFSRGAIFSIFEYASESYLACFILTTSTHR